MSYFFFLHTIGPNDLLHPLQHIFKLSRDFLSALPSVPVSALHKAMLQMKNFTSSFLNFCSVWWRKDSSATILLVTRCIASNVRTNDE